MDEELVKEDSLKTNAVELHEAAPKVDEEPKPSSKETSKKHHIDENVAKSSQMPWISEHHSEKEPQDQAIDQ